MEDFPDYPDEGNDIVGKLLTKLAIEAIYRMILALLAKLRALKAKKPSPIDMPAFF